MKISGFTIIRNAVINDYPIVEAILSILPVVDEMVVAVGDSEDDTEALIRSIPSDKIRIFHSTWDLTIKNSGSILAIETDKAFHQIASDSDWAFYIQGDEVVHEKYHAAILEGARQYLDNPRVEGLLFKYLHFYGTFDYVGDSRKWYSHEVRMIRNDKNICAYRDAQGFRKGKKKLNVKPLDACVYHYGWVKSPHQMRKKINHVSQFWNDGRDWNYAKTEEVFNFDDFDSLKRFTDTHPGVMQDRIARQNWNITLDTTKKHFGFKDRLLYHIEKITGKRLFEFRNYRII